MPNKDKVKQLASQRAWYRRNASKEKVRLAIRRKTLKLWYNELKLTLKCSRCTENHPACLEFHHLNSDEKEVDISNMVNNCYSKSKILAEISKCQVLCANCHRKEHYKDYEQLTRIGLEEFIYKSVHDVN